MGIPHIDVCICTFRRPQLLQKLLLELAAIETKGRFHYSITIADNDRNESARDVVQSLAAKVPVTISYCVEPVQNIALARNRILQHGNGDFIALIDDDELPSKTWLCALFSTYEKTQADGVLGPVLPYFPDDVPDWFKKSGIYDFRKRHPTGSKLHWGECRTGNALIRRQVFESLPGPFREEFGTGGEDQDFFRRAVEQGCEFVWCDEAVVHEIIQPSRYDRRVLLSRALLRGRDTFKHRRNRRRNLAKALIAVPVYSLALPFFLLGGQHRFMKLANQLTSHIGLLLACVGLNPMRHREM